MIDLNDVLLAMSNIPVDDPIAEIWGRGLQGGYKIIQYTGALPITINANGDALLDYRIYGADGGIGEPTENLINASLSEQTIEIKPSTSYAVSRYIDTPGQSASDLRFGVYDENDNLLWSDYLGTWWGENIKVYDNAKYFKITIPNRYLNVVSLVEGARPAGLTNKDPYPENYIPYGYKLPMVTRTENLFDYTATDTNNGYVFNSYISADGEITPANGWRVSEYIRVRDNTNYFIKIDTGGYNDRGVVFYDSNKNYISGNNYRYAASNLPFLTPSNAEFLRFTIRYSTEQRTMLVEGSTNPPNYIPYSRIDTPVYIGENQLDADEYVSYSDGKIYRMVNGTLTPTDLPADIPDIPTIEGETVIDYDGTPKPSQMYIKYKSKE